MRLTTVILAAVLFAGAGFGVQQPSEPPPQQGQERKPTLGPAPEPSLSGPRTSATMDARKLMRVRTIYVERIDNSLSEKLADGLAKMGRFRVVTSRNEADAVMRGTCFDSRRLKSLHSEVYLADRNGQAIWQDIVRRSFNPPPIQKAVDSTALEILQHLGESVKEAERKQ